MPRCSPSSSTGGCRPPIPGWALWLAALLVVVAGGADQPARLRGWRLGAVLLLQIASDRLAPLPAPAIGHRHARPAGLRLGRAAGCSPSSASARRRARSARSSAASPSRRSANISRADIANEIMRDPERLALHGEKTQIYALFTDLEGFTKLSHAITPETAVGPAQPLSRPDERDRAQAWRHDRQVRRRCGGRLLGRADRAARRCRSRAARRRSRCTRPAMSSASAAGEDCRRSACTRVGLHRGEAMVGNFGGEGRIQYTALGDGMNTAARLESANKSLKTTMLVSGEAKARFDARRLPADGPDRGQRPRDPGRGLGAGAGHGSGAARASSTRSGCASTAATRRRSFSSRTSPRNTRRMQRLQLFVYRIREAGPGGHFVLGSK